MTVFFRVGLAMDKKTFDIIEYYRNKSFVHLLGTPEKIKRAVLLFLTGSRLTTHESLEAFDPWPGAND